MPKEIRPEIISALHNLRFTRFLNSRMLPNPPKGFCKWCGKKFTGRVWCSKECRREGYIRMGYYQNYVFERDKGICNKCGIDTIWLGEEIRKIHRLWRKHFSKMPHSYSEYQTDFGPWGIDSYKQLWEADHIIPVCEGGGCCGLENYQTLCIRCHKEDSARLAKKRAVKPVRQFLFSEYEPYQR